MSKIDFSTASQQEVLDYLAQFSVQSNSGSEIDIFYSGVQTSHTPSMANAGYNMIDGSEFYLKINNLKQTPEFAQYLEDNP